MKIELTKEETHVVTLTLSAKEFKLLRGTFQNCPVQNNTELMQFYRDMFEQLSPATRSDIRPGTSAH